MTMTNTNYIITTPTTSALQVVVHCRAQLAQLRNEPRRTQCVCSSRPAACLAVWYAALAAHVLRTGAHDLTHALHQPLLALQHREAGNNIGKRICKAATAV